MDILDDKQKLAKQESQDSQASEQSQASQQSQQTATETPRGARSTQQEQRDGAQPVVTDGFIVPDLDVPAEAPPAYGDQHDLVQFSQPGFEAGAAVTDDGRVNINILTKNRRLADLLAPTLAHQVSADTIPALPPAYIPPSLGAQPGKAPPPRLNVVIQIVGSRGDVQPFVALGKVLKETYGHRVRIATHGTFQPFVEENGLEFFCISGDPAELMAFMVKHPGLMPGIDALKSGEISKRRRGIQDILVGCWRSCIEAGNGLGPPPKPHAKNEPLDLSAGMPGDQTQEPFVADAIIANPPSFAHIHVAEKLGIPLHMMFTMPWSPTRAFPHPLANIQSSNADDVMTNYMSYTLVEMMTWQGLGDIINRFREKALDLAPLSLIWAPGLLTRLKIPYTYCWSPALIPKPNDWKNNIDISGFYFLNLASSYTPEPDLAAFLEAGPPPVYIGFGSIVVDDPNAMTRMIFDAVHLAGVRALVSKGWGGLGADDVGLPEGVFMLGNVPHDWLFQRVSCVVHHGGAGTTAAGIKAGRPTIVVPFFGDQPFWGAMVSRAKAGSDPIPYKDLTAEKLSEAIKFCLKPETLEQAKELGERIREEDGTDAGGKSFHQHLDLDSLRCVLAPSRVAVWRVRRTKVRLSSLAVAVLIEEGLLQYADVKLYRSHEYNTEDQPPDPISAGAASLVMDLSGIGMAIADMPREMFKTGQRSVKERFPNQHATEDSSSKTPDSPREENPKTSSTSDLSTLASRGRTESTRAGTGSIADLPASPRASQQSLIESTSLVTTPTELEPSVSEETTQERPSRSHMKKAFTRREPSPVGVGLDVAISAGKNIERAVSTGVKSPMNFCLGLAKGFRNIPRLYNDDTVRPIEKVTDFNSGIRIAGKELGYGFFDGVAGLVTQPWKGAEKEGAGGFVKGIGKGIGGIIAKPAAGIWGLPAYMMQGVHAEMNKFLTRSVHNYIVTSRIVQGQRDLRGANEDEKADIILRWNTARPDLKNFYHLKRRQTGSLEKSPPSSETASVADSTSSRHKTGWLHTRHMSWDERKKAHAQKESLKKGHFEAPARSTSGGSSARQSMSEDAEFEQAIQASVLETSRGNAEEDAMIEAAIRESVSAVRQRGSLPDPVREAPAEKDTKDAGIFKEEDLQITDEEYQSLIEKAIQESISAHGGHMPPPQEIGLLDLDPDNHGSSSGPAGHRPPTDENDEDLKRAIEESRNAPAAPSGQAADDDEEFQRAIAASKEEQGKMTEEEIVMEYVKKQSLAEEEYRRKIREGKGKESAGTEEEVSEEHEAELRKAMEESLRLTKGDDSGPSGSKEA